MKFSINWYGVVLLLFALFLGFTERVDWWTISLIWVLQMWVSAKLFKITGGR